MGIPEQNLCSISQVLNSLILEMSHCGRKISLVYAKNIFGILCSIFCVSMRYLSADIGYLWIPFLVDTFAIHNS
jgi:hypothetical protein